MPGKLGAWHSVGEIDAIGEIAARHLLHPSGNEKLGARHLICPGVFQELAVGQELAYATSNSRGFRDGQHLIAEALLCF